MSLNWIDITTAVPPDGQQCLTKMKHGIISGFYSAVEKKFFNYYYNLEWVATHWTPIEEAENG